MKYEEAHRHADTLFPRDLWESAEHALAPIRAACGMHAAAIGAEVRENLSTKHPHPARIITKRLGRVSVSVEIYAEPASGSLRYQLGVTRTARGAETTWEPVRCYEGGELGSANTKVLQEFEALVAKALG